MAVTMFAVIDTSLFGMITPSYGGRYNSWINRPLWFAALLASSYFLLLCYFTFKIVKKKPWNNFELFALILFIPSIIAAVNSSAFSNLGFLTILNYSSIPTIAAMACAILSMETIKKRESLVQLMIVILFFVPFYYTTAWFDWKFTFFDVAPEQANAEIEHGFGRGIKTNQIYKNLYEWISKTSQAYSSKDDFIISYDSSPMVHMIARRRPALSLSNLAFNEQPDSYFDKQIEFMKSRGRKPQLVYVFEAMPVLVPISLENPARFWEDKQFYFPSDDPISLYVLANMTMIESFTISNELSLSVRCFIDDASALSVLENKLNIDPANPALNMQMGNFYQKKGELDKAQKYFQKTLDANPKFILALMQLAINQSMKGNELNAVLYLKRIVAIEPNRIDAYYNIACIYARQKKIEDSIVWLEKAVNNGFNKWELLQTDSGLANIRGTTYYKNLMKKLSVAPASNEINME
jgi:tetratricopeptide (TPR) repeat protein